MAAYQTALPSFLAASISAGVTGLGSGAAARAGRANAATAAAEALSMSLRVRMSGPAQTPNIFE
jgi:hypothetical protein